MADTEKPTTGLQGFALGVAVPAFIALTSVIFMDSCRDKCPPAHPAYIVPAEVTWECSKGQYQREAAAERCAESRGSSGACAACG